MKVPPLIIGAALLLWGVETDNILISAFVALFLEGCGLTTTRYNFTSEDFVKISDLTSLLLLGSIALVILNFEATSFLSITASWLPLIVLPLIAAQLYSTGQTIVIGTRLGGKKTYAHQPVDVRFYYVMVCIFAAATGNSRDLWFYPATGLILAWFLYSNRQQSSSATLILLLLTVSLGLGFATNKAIEMGYGYALDKANSYWRGYHAELNSDPYKSHVNFGDTGRLKTSGEIIMRVDASIAPPELFKEVVYSIFATRNWLGSLGDFVPLEPIEETKWHLIPQPHKDGNRIGVQYNLPKEKGVLPYPQGCYLLESKTIYSLEHNNRGVVKITDGAPVISYDLYFHPEMLDMADLPTARNLNIPENERHALQEVISQIGYPGSTDALKIAAIHKHLQKDYSYSFEVMGRGGQTTPLGNFLLQRKTGFCEYFATATTLLLRMYGIPSRYVVGYAVFEKSRLEGKYVVRKRHAHAWSEAFVDGRWIVVDSTPPNWKEKDLEQASIFEGHSRSFELYSPPIQIVSDWWRDQLYPAFIDSRGSLDSFPCFPHISSNANSAGWWRERRYSCTIFC